MSNTGENPFNVGITFALLIYNSFLWQNVKKLHMCICGILNTYATSLFLTYFTYVNKNRTIKDYVS